MTEPSNWMKARSSAVFLAALATAAALVWLVESRSEHKNVKPAVLAVSSRAEPAAVPQPLKRYELKTSSDLPPPRAKRALTDDEQQWARTAWIYFKNNTNPVTGLAGSVDGFPSATMWDTGSFLFALVSARELKLIAPGEFDSRIAMALSSLARIELFDGALPNKSYDIATLAMANEKNQAVEGGIGWSALDIGRLAVPLNLIAINFPQHTAAVRKVLSRWNLKRLASDGHLVGARVANGKIETVQEGRLGYEQLAAKSLALMGLPVEEAIGYGGFLAETVINDIAVPHDMRDASTLGANNYVVSEPYILNGLEFGGDRYSSEFAWRIFRVQEERFRRTGVLTAVSEDHLDRAPYFVYNSVFANGKSWQTITDAGESVPALRNLSVKAAFGWYALYESDYGNRLINAVKELNDPSRGWYGGRYEEGGAPNKSINANTNAVILESLSYIVSGKQYEYR